LDLKLLVQSVPITTKVVSLNPVLEDFWMAWWFMVFNATLSNISVHGGGWFYWWRKPKI
jgi:hypothetical protein